MNNTEFNSQLTKTKRGKRLRELIHHIGLIPKVIPLKFNRDLCYHAHRVNVLLEDENANKAAWAVHVS